MKKKKNLWNIWLRSGCILLLVALTVSVTGCRSFEESIPEEHPLAWTPSEIENVFAGPDPIEGYNRCMFACTDFVMNYVADPLGRIYASLFPRPFIKHLDNVSVNLDYPAHLFSCLLQKEWRGADDETRRFFVNSTVGVAGIFDPAAAWLHIPSTGADFGQTFACWGIGPGHTFMLPLVATTNSRDLIGMIFDIAFDIKTYIPYAGYATALNDLVIKQSLYVQATDDTLDPYKRFRQLSVVQRELQRDLWFYRQSCRMIDRAKAKMAAEERAEKYGEMVARSAERIAGKPAEPTLDKPPVLTGIIPPEGPKGLHGRWIGLPEYHSQDPVIDSIRSIMARATREQDFWFMRLSIFNRDFTGAASVRRLELAPGRPKMIYGFWKAEKPEKKEPPREETLAILLPGIGGTWNAALQVAIAETFHDAGYHVAAFDSLFHARFARCDGTRRLPGYLPDDAARVRKAILAVLADLKKSGKIKTPRIILCGYSLGGIQTLKIAQLEETDPQIAADRYIAINPPVSVMSAMRTIDSLINTSAGWTKTEMRRRLLDAAGTLFVMTQVAFPKFDQQLHTLDPEQYQVNIDPDSASFLVGVSLKLSMSELVMTAHREKPLPGIPACSWGHRNAAYLAIDRFSMQDYAAKLLAPLYAKPLEALGQQCSLYDIERTLQTNPKIRIFHNYDDFLLTKEDRRWLDGIMGERLVWFSNGGHLGNLYYLTVLKEILNSAGGDAKKPVALLKK